MRTTDCETRERIEAIIEACDQQVEGDPVASALISAMLWFLGDKDLNQDLYFGRILHESEDILAEINAKREEECDKWAAECDRVTTAWDKWGDRSPSNDLDYCMPSGMHTPDELAFDGLCILVALADPLNLYDGDDKCEDYISPVNHKPTWGDVARQFDQAIVSTGDYHHCFLEGISEISREEWPEYLHEIGVDNDVTVLQFDAGS